MRHKWPPIEVGTTRVQTCMADGCNATRQVTPNGTPRYPDGFVSDCGNDHSIAQPKDRPYVKQNKGLRHVWPDMVPGEQQSCARCGFVRKVTDSGIPYYPFGNMPCHNPEDNSVSEASLAKDWDKPENDKWDSVLTKEDREEIADSKFAERERPASSVGLEEFLQDRKERKLAEEKRDREAAENAAKNESVTSDNKMHIDMIYQLVMCMRKNRVYCSELRVAERYLLNLKIPLV